MTERISALRRRMIEDMSARRLAVGSQRAHIRSCKRLAAFLGRSPETASREDIRRFQLHFAEEKVSITTRNAVMSGVKFLSRVTLRRLDLAEEIYRLNEPQRVPVILSVNEVKRLLAVVLIHGLHLEDFWSRSGLIFKMLGCSVSCSAIVSNRSKVSLQGS